MPILLTSINTSALQADGSYTSLQLVESQLPQGINTQLMALVGSANWGPVNKPMFTSSYQQGTPIFGDTFVNTAGTGTPDYGLQARIDVADAVASNFLSVRVTDDTDVAAETEFLDASSGEVFMLAGKYTGSLGSKIKSALALQSGTSSVKPVYTLTITPPYGNPEVFGNLVAYSSSAYSAATFLVNLLAAVNGTGVGANASPGSNWVVASAGSSSLAPVVASQTLSGGTDGAASLTDATLLGTDGFAGSRSGMYALRGLIAGATLCVCGISGASGSNFSAVNAFVQSELAIGILALPFGTDTEEAISDRTSSSLSSAYIMLMEDWVKENDPAGRGVLWQDPAGGAAGIVAGTPPYLYPGNKPVKGLPTIFATESTIGVPIGVGSTDAGARESNGINWIGNPIPRGALFGLYHGMMSDGETYCSDVRMAFFIAVQVNSILGNFVGDSQTDAVDDDTRAAARAAVNAFMNSLLPPNTQQINNYADTLDSTNNTSESVEEGLMLCSLAVETLNAVRFAVTAIQAGVGVQISVGPAT